MKRLRTGLLILPLIFTCVYLDIVTAQSPAALPRDPKSDEVRLGVDLVVLDALVLNQKTSRAVGDLKREDFTLVEDGVKQQISHFSQDSLPLSVVLLVDRGGCLDPLSEKVRQATSEALRRLKPEDEVALMTFADDTELVERFTFDRSRIARAIGNIGEHDENAGHCFNRAFYEAARYIRRAGNPDGRRVIIVITGQTTSFDCPGPSSEEVRQEVLESGTVVCGLIPKTRVQRLESGAYRALTAIGGVFKLPTSSLKELSEETGGEVMHDKPEVLDASFNNLIAHLRTRYTVGFVSTNARRDGGFRKLRLDIAPTSFRRDEKLVVKTRRGYVASRGSFDRIEPDHKR